MKTPREKLRVDEDGNADPAEVAYRRGFHQAVACILHLQTGDDFGDIGEVIDVDLAKAERIARELRSSRFAHRAFGHEFLRLCRKRARRAKT